MSSYILLKQKLDILGCEYSEGVLLSGLTSFKIGGNADMILFPESEEMLSAVVRACNENGIRFFVLFW